MHEHQDRPYFVHSVVVRSWVSGCEVVYCHIESSIFAGNTLSESPFLLCYTIATDTSTLTLKAHLMTLSYVCINKNSIRWVFYLKILLKIYLISIGILIFENHTTTAYSFNEIPFFKYV